MELRRWFLIGRRWFWLITLITLVAAAAAYGFSKLQRKQYSATASLIINQGQQPGTSYSDVLASQQLAKSYAAVATSRPVLTAAAQALGLSANAVSSSCACLTSGRLTVVRISSDVPVNTQLVTVTATSARPQRAADGANAVAAAFSDAIKRAQFGSSEPSVDALNAQIQAVQASIQKTSDDIAALSPPGRIPNASDAAQVSILQSQLTQQQSTLASLTGQLTQVKLAQSNATNAVSIFDPAVAPSHPFSPRTSFNVVLATILGLLIGGGIALLLEYLDDRVQSPADVEAATEGAATLGVIEKLDPAKSESGINAQLLLEPGGSFSSAHEEYRLLRSNFEFAVADRRVKTLLVTSAQASEGKSTTAANLAIVLAQTGRSVILVDADMRQPSLHKLFGVPNESGFALGFLLNEPTALLSLLVQTEYENLQLLPSGPPPPNPTELLSSGRVRQLIKLLSKRADIVIFDSSPTLAVADAAELAARVDRVLLVVDSSRTRPSQLAAAAASLQRASASILGVVLNKLQRTHTTRAYHYYSYGSKRYRPRQPLPAADTMDLLVRASRSAVKDERDAGQAPFTPYGADGPSRNGHNGHNGTYGHTSHNGRTNGRGEEL